MSQLTSGFEGMDCDGGNREKITWRGVSSRERKEKNLDKVL